LPIAFPYNSYVKIIYQIWGFAISNPKKTSLFYPKGQKSPQIKNPAKESWVFTKEITDFC
jgi:hypothetical protein